MMSAEDNLTSPRIAATASLVLSGWVRREPAAPSPSTPRWQELIRAVDATVESGETGAMLRAWQAASVEAQFDQGWQSMVAVGDAAVRIGRATGLRFAFGVKARQAYHVALFRSHRANFVDGVLAAAEGFAELGDAEVVTQCTSVALRLASNQPGADVAARIEVLRARLTRPS